VNPTIKYFEVNALGTQTSAWQYGASEGPLLILVHGFRGDHHGLEGLAVALSQLVPELRVVVPDLPGFGETPALEGRTHDLALYGEWLCALADELTLGERTFSILGHSFGSLVVANALSQGLAPTSISLINPIASPALEGPQAVMTQLAIAYYRVAAMLPEAPSRALLGNPLIVRAMSEVMAKTRDRSLRAWIHGQHNQYFSRFADSRTLLEAFRASVSHTVMEYAAAFTSPTLLIAGDRDDITPLSKQLELAHRIEDAKLHVVQGVGHLVHYEAVDFAAETLAALLRDGAKRRHLTDHNEMRDSA